MQRYSKQALLFLALLIFGVLISLFDNKPLVFESETLYFQSPESLSWSDIFNNKIQNHTQVNISAQLQLPHGAKQKIPVMIIMHGSGGILKGREDRYVKELNSQGIATLVVDSFTPRGRSAVIDCQECIQTSTLLGDVYAALAELKKRPRIDPQRIGVMGFSKGGSVAIFAMDEQVRQSLATVAEDQFKVSVAFYPACTFTFKKPRPGRFALFMLLGESDTYTPAAQCENQAKDLKNAGFNINVIKYPKAYHAWDIQAPLHFSKRDYSFGKCSFEALNDGTVFDLVLKVPIHSQEDLRKSLQNCQTHGAWLGANEEVAKKSMQDLVIILKKHL